MRALVRGLGRWASMWIPLSVIGAAACGDAGAGEAVDGDAIRGGVETAEKGVVGLLFPGNKFCTGSLISDDALVTAAHCLPGTSFTLKVAELRSDGRYQCLTALGDQLAAPGEDMGRAFARSGCLAMPVVAIGGDTGSSETDVAVVRLTSNRFWKRQPGDGLRILRNWRLAQANGLDAALTPGFFKAVGAGPDRIGGPAGRVRTGVFFLEDDEPFDMNLEATAAQGACQGDSGGPIGFNNRVDLGPDGPRYTIAGVLSRGTVEGAPEGCATDAGDNQWYTRITPFESSIEALLGRPCRVRSFATVPPVEALDCDNARACTGDTPVGATAWTQVAPDTLAVDVDTRQCGYTGTPLYFPSLSGLSNHYRALGVSSVVSPTAGGFRVIVRDLTGPITPAIANTRGWSVNWQGTPSGSFGFNCAGRTLPGGTHWHATPGGLYVDVDTSACGTLVTPRFLTSFGGLEDTTEVTGMTSIYLPSTSGFRVYLHKHDGSVITPAEANTRQWHLNWMADPAIDAREYCAGSSVASGWEAYGAQAVTRWVDTTHCGLRTTPRILTSLGGNSHHWRSTGVTSLYDVGPTGFRVYIHDETGPITPAIAEARGYHVNYAIRR